MAENSKIEWTNHTFNPWMGCTKVSAACANCYAERDFDHRYGKVQWGPSGTRVLTSDANWAKPLAWNREAEKTGTRAKVFCASLADVFENWQGPIKDSRGLLGHVFDDGEWGFGPDGADGTNNYRGGSNVSMLTMNDVRDRLFRLIDSTPYLDWLLLTKRPDNVPLMWPIHPSGRHQEGMSFADAYRRDNVWLGVSVENQEYADKRIPELLKCRELSPVLFLSCEPVVGQINLPGDVHCPYCEGGICDPETGVVECETCDGSGVRNDVLEFGFDWVIAGGESGPNARPADPEWFRSLRDQCKTAGVPFHFKQWGEFDEHQVKVGKKNAGRLLDGETHDGLPVVSVQV